MLLMKVAVVPWAEYSPRKIEIGMEKITEMTRARKEVASVPTRKEMPQIHSLPDPMWN